MTGGAGGGPEAASRFVTIWAAKIKAGGQVLDLAAGNGRHSRLLKELALRVTAVDLDTGALARIPGIEIVGADLEAAPWPLPGRRFDGIVVSNYLWRPLLPEICAALAPGGLLIYETFACGNERFGKPSNPDFLLRPGELIELARAHDLTVLAYEHGEETSPRPAMRQRMAAARLAADV